jgi:hypothetical protein
VRRSLLLLVLLGLGLGASCGGYAERGTTATGAPPTTAPATSSAEPPPTTVVGPTAEEVLEGDGEAARVVLLGDSVMSTLRPALRAALGAPGQGARFRLYTVLPDAGFSAEAAQDLVGVAEVVVVMIGRWEATAIAEGSVDGVDPSDPAWPAVFREQVVVPWLRSVRQAGPEVIWVGMVNHRDPARGVPILALNRVFEAAVARVPGASFVDAAAVLADEHGRYQDGATGPDGEALRLMARDGSHLCPDGAALVADAVLALLPPGLAGQADPDFRANTGWRHDPALAETVWGDPERVCPTAD